MYPHRGDADVVHAGDADAAASAGVRRALVLFALPPPLLAAAQADISKWLAAGPRIHNVAAQFALSHACWLVTYLVAGVVGNEIGLFWTFGVLGLLVYMLIST